MHVTHIEMNLNGKKVTFSMSRTLRGVVDVLYEGSLRVESINTNLSEDRQMSEGETICQRLAETHKGYVAGFGRMLVNAATFLVAYSAYNPDAVLPPPPGDIPAAKDARMFLVTPDNYAVHVQFCAKCQKNIDAGTPYTRLTWRTPVMPTPAFAYYHLGCDAEIKQQAAEQVKTRV